jgi:hypothetical protein
MKTWSIPLPSWLFLPSKMAANPKPSIKALEIPFWPSARGKSCWIQYLLMHSGRSAIHFARPHGKSKTMGVLYPAITSLVMEPLTGFLSYSKNTTRGIAENAYLYLLKQAFASKNLFSYRKVKLCPNSVKNCTTR